MTPDLLPERLATRVLVDENGCWLWQGAQNGDGYGKVWLNSRYSLTHRVAYEVAVEPIPDGYQIDHLCRVRGCCNPAHLEAVTPLENHRRGVYARMPEGHVIKPRSVGPRRLSTHCPEGHERTPENTYLRSCGKRRCRPCAVKKQREYRLRQAA